MPSLIFLGPSGVGKSRWRESVVALPGNPYKGIEMDERIGRNPRLLSLLSGVPGKDEAERMGKAMGRPWENPKRYAQLQKISLDAEAEEMEGLYEEMKASPRQRFVADLSGSAVYCRGQIEKVLALGMGVYLEASPAHFSKMRDNFLAHPKPVYWGRLIEDWQKLFDAGGQEGAKAHLPELYEALLQYRHQLYRFFADVTVPWEVHRGLQEPQEFLRLLESA